MNETKKDELKTSFIAGDLSRNFTIDKQKGLYQKLERK